VAKNLGANFFEGSSVKLGVVGSSGLVEYLPRKRNATAHSVPSSIKASHQQV
jgi:hypothetical protein